MNRNMAALLITLIASALLVLAACDDNGSSSTPTATSAPATSDGGDDGLQTPSPEPPPTDEATEPVPSGAFEGVRGPFEGTGTGDNFPAAVLVDARTAAHEDFDRIVFEFRDSRPHFRAEYLAASAVACGSGLEVDVTGGAVLQVRMTIAAAHDDEGNQTFESTMLSPGLASILEVVSTCDFEGELTWVLGLTEEVDFNVSTLPDPFRIVVDVAHPD